MRTRSVHKYLVICFVRSRDREVLICNGMLYLIFFERLLLVVNENNGNFACSSLGWPLFEGTFILNLDNTVN